MWKNNNSKKLKKKKNIVVIYHNLLKNYILLLILDVKLVFFNNHSRSELNVFRSTKYACIYAHKNYKYVFKTCTFFCYKMFIHMPIVNTLWLVSLMHFYSYTKKYKNIKWIHILVNFYELFLNIIFQNKYIEQINGLKT